jgi:NAD(P)-dependent dehydrogenase (short-subunit alcohol dehydrogenase family)
MKSARLTGLNAIVTGATGGIGSAICERFRQEGAKVVGIDREGPAGGDFIACDVANSPAVDAAMEKAAAKLDGRLDILVTAAALLGGRAAFPDVTDQEWRGYIDVNLSGTFFVCRAAAKVMIAGKQGGSIVTIGSVNSIAAEEKASPYVASKGGVALLSRAMAVDLAAHRIRVNMIAPGPIEVPRNSAVFRSPGFRRGLAEMVPMGEAGQPDDIANAAVFLAEASSHMVTGTTITVDGGLMARIPSFARD